MSDNISDKDKKDWQNFINNSEKLPNKDIKKEFKPNKKIKSIDLHGFSLEEANEFVETFINKSFKDGVRKLIIVTGKGLHSTNDKDIYVSKNLGTLRYSVPEFIKSSEELSSLIISIAQADIKDGGEGAIIIKLK